MFNFIFLQDFQRRHILLITSVAYSVIISLGIMSYLHHYESLQVVTSSNSFTYLSHQKKIHVPRRAYSPLLRSLSKESTSYQDLFEHHDYKNFLNQSLKLPCPSCALVSSSGRLLNTGAGKEIDSTTCVFRMNDAPVSGYEKDVGVRTTVRSMGHVNLVKSFEKDNFSRNEIFVDERTRTEIFLINWMNNIEVDVFSDKGYRFAVLLAHLYPHVQFYSFTPKKMNNTEELFKNETGVYSYEAKTWLSTGFFTMVAALDVCDEITVYGMAHEDICMNPKKAFQDYPYHYYESDGRKECQYFKRSESKLQSGHLFITEKAIFANWASRSGKIKFKYPTWPVKNATSKIDYTPYFKALEIDKEKKKKKKEEEKEIKKDKAQRGKKNTKEKEDEVKKNKGLTLL